MSSERENRIGCQEMKLLLNVNKGLSTSSLALITNKNSIALNIKQYKKSTKFTSTCR